MTVSQLYKITEMQPKKTWLKILILESACGWICRCERRTCSIYLLWWFLLMFFLLSVLLVLSLVVETYEVVLQWEVYCFIPFWTWCAQIASTAVFLYLTVEFCATMLLPFSIPCVLSENCMCLFWLCIVIFSFFPFCLWNSLHL